MAASVVAVVLFLMARTSVLSFYHANEVASIKKIDNFLAAKDITTEARLATAILILGYYVKLLFVPYPLISDYSFNSIPLVHFSDPVVLLTLALYIFLAAFAVFNIVKRRKNYMAFAFLFFLITISLFSNIILLIGTNMGERLMFFPSVGFCIAIALLIEQFAKDATGTAIGFLKNAKVLAIIVPVALIYMVITVNRNTDWFSNYTLYTKDIPKAPNSSRLNYLLGTEIETNAGDEKDPVKKKATQDSVITYLKRSLAICPDYSEAECNLGYEYFLNLQFDSAEYHTKRSIELTHNQDNAVNNLAAIYINESKFTEAINLCKSAIALNPYAVNPYVNMAACYLNIHKYDSAIIFSRKAIDIDRSNSRSYLFISIAYKAMGRIDSANIYEAMSKKQ